ncbi:unnamed protein product [Parajaminaea phylloscopi]
MRWYKVREALWGPPPATKEEARLVRKVDFFVLTFTCLMYWSNYLSRTGFQFAYVSGMREDLAFHGNQYSIVNTLFTVGYIVSMIPNMLMLQVVSPHLWLPLTAATWAALSMCLAAARTPAHVMAIRFLQGMAESSTFAGTHYILGSWYTDTEIGKRSGIFASSAQLGSLFSGVLQGSIQRNLQGHKGLRAWQWQFLFDGFIGLPIACYGWAFFPDVPQRARKWLLSEPERKLAIERLPVRQQSATTMDRALAKRVLGRWHWYAFSALFAWSSMLESIGSNGLFPLWLQAEGYPVRDRNYWPLGLQAVAIASTLIAATLTDIRGIPRWAVNPVMALALVVASALLLVWEIPFGWKFFAFTLGGVGYAGQASNFGWANVVCAEDEQERAIVLASMNLWSNVVQSWWSIVFYPATDAPKFRRGWLAMICVAVVTVVIALTVRHLDVKEQRQRSRLLATLHEATSGRTSPGAQSHRGKKRGLAARSPWLALLLSPALCALVAGVAEAASVHPVLKDDYHEDLHLRPLPTGRTHTAFTFTLSSNDTSPGSDGARHYHLLPPPLLAMLDDSTFPIEELSLSFNKGRWDYERWGTPYFSDAKGHERGSRMVASGAEAWVRYGTVGSRRGAAESVHHPTEAQTEDFHALLSAMSGQFCSTLAAAGSREAISKSSNLTRSFFRSPSRPGRQDTVLYLNLPPSPCTEVLHPFLALLPCKRAAGLASLLDPHAWLNTEWHGIELKIQRSGPSDRGWEITIRVGSVWNGVVRDSRRDFTLSRIFGTSLRSACPLASSSAITLLAPPRGLDDDSKTAQYDVGAIPADFPVAESAGDDDDDDDDDHAQHARNETSVANRLRNHLRHRGYINYPVVKNLQGSESRELDVGLTWPHEEYYNYTTSAAPRSNEPINVRRSFISSNQLEGRLLLTFKNDRMDRSRRIVYRDVLPWFLSLDVHSAAATVQAFELPDDSPFIRFESDIHGSPVRRLAYTEGVPRQRPEVLEMELVIPPMSRVDYSVRFEKHTIRYEEHPPDAHRGLEVGAATVWEIEDREDHDHDHDHDSGEERPRRRGRSASLPDIDAEVLATWKTEVALVEVAVPDFSMPYNVIIFTSTLLALFAGSAINLLTRRFVDVDVPSPPDTDAAAEEAKQEAVAAYVHRAMSAVKVK